MASLTYTTAARIATRELHSSRGKFTFVILSVAIGVAALTGVRGFSASFRTMLSLRARSIMAGDLSAKTTQQPTPAEQAGLDHIAAEGVDFTQVVELNSMASAAIFRASSMFGAIAKQPGRSGISLRRLWVPARIGRRRGVRRKSDDWAVSFFLWHKT